MSELDVRSCRPSERIAKSDNSSAEFIVQKQSITNPYQKSAVNSFGENRPIESKFAGIFANGGQQLFALNRAETGVFTAATGRERIL